MSKLIIHNKIKDRTLCLSDLDGTFDDVIKVIRQWKSDYEALCSEGEWCKLDLDYYGYDSGSSPEFNNRVQAVYGNVTINI